MKNNKVQYVPVYAFNQNQMTVNNPQGMIIVAQQPNVQFIPSAPQFNPPAFSPSYNATEGQFIAKQEFSNLPCPQQNHHSPQVSNTVTFSLNGKKHTVEPDPMKTLNEYIREQSGLQGTKITCNQGGCGNCTGKEFMQDINISFSLTLR